MILRDGSVASFNELLKRIRRRRRGPSDEPVTFVAFDVHRANGIDVAAQGIEERRDLLQVLLTENERIVASGVFAEGSAL